MNGNSISKVMRWLGPAFALGLTACSTMTVTLQGTAGEGMNPNRAGGSGTLQVYAFFLKKRDAFLQKDKLLGDFLVKSVLEDRKPPPFLEQDVVAIDRIEIPPGAPGKTTPVVQRIEVSKEAVCVGLVAAFQSHKDNDPDEVWRLPVEVKGGLCSFQVTGRRLEECAPKKKEAPRATGSDGS